MLTPSTVFVTTPKLRSIEISVEGRTGNLMAFDWLSADCELRGIAADAPPPAGSTRVTANVTWHDNVVTTVSHDVYRGDDMIPENLLVRVLRREGLLYTLQTHPVDRTAKEWEAHLRGTFRDLFDAFVARWRRILARLPEKADHVPVNLMTEEPTVEQAAWWQVPPGADAAAITLPAGPPVANDAAVAAAETGPTGAPVFTGSKHVSGRDKAETAKLMRAELKEIGANGTPEIPKGTTFRVTIDRYSMGSSINVRIIPPADFLAVNVERIVADLGLAEERGAWLSEKGTALVDAVSQIHASYNRDASDTMVDYFDVDFHGDAKLDGDFESNQRAIVRQTLQAAFPNAKKGVV